MLKPTDVMGKVVFLGLVPPGGDSLRSAPMERMALGFDGPAGESHAGRTRPSCVRVKRQYPVGTEIANTRQLSILSVEELAEVAAAMEIERIAPEWTGATLVFEGIPDLTGLPPSSRLIFENGASIVNDIENGPCDFVGRELEKEYPGKGRAFPQKARGKRGVCGWVERPGEIALGMTARVHIPPKRVWAGL